PGAQMELKGKNEFLILLPDKFLKSETLEALNGTSALTRIEVVDGDRSWGEINAGGHEKSERFEQRFEQGLVTRMQGRNRRSASRHCALVAIDLSSRGCCWRYC